MQLPLTQLSWVESRVGKPGALKYLRLSAAPFTIHSQPAPRGNTRQQLPPTQQADMQTSTQTAEAETQQHTHVACTRTGAHTHTHALQSQCISLVFHFGACSMLMQSQSSYLPLCPADGRVRSTRRKWRRERRRKEEKKANEELGQTSLDFFVK